MPRYDTMRNSEAKKTTMIISLFVKMRWEGSGVKVVDPQIFGVKVVDPHPGLGTLVSSPKTELAGAP